MDDTYGLRPGDLLRGRNTGNTYEVVSVESSERVRTKLISLGHSPKGGNHIGEVHINNVSALDFAEHGTYYNPNPTNNTTTKENNDMNTQQINAAINTLNADEALRKVRPVHERMTAIVNGTAIGEVLYIKGRKKDAVFGSQFYCHDAEDRWLYGNGTAIQTTDEVITRLVQWTMERKVKITRLVAETS